MHKFLEEFKQFAMRGNVIDLAIGVIIGGAFGKIVSSLVSDIIMPPIGFILGGADFTSLSLTIKEAVIKNGAVVNEAITINYGNFIQTVVDFTIIAFVIFMVIKAVNKEKAKKEEKKKEKPKEPSENIQLLREIRDELKKNN